MQLQRITMHLGQQGQLSVNLHIILRSSRRSVGNIFQRQVACEYLFFQAIGSIALDGATAVGSIYFLQHDFLFVSSEGQTQLVQAITLIG